MAKLNFKKISNNMFNMYQECGSLQMVLDHPDIAPVKRDSVGLYRVMHCFMPFVSPTHFVDFAYQSLRLNNIDERKSVMQVLVEHLFGFHTHNTVLIHQIFQKCLYAPNVNPSVLHSWMKRGHQSLAKEYWETSSGNERAHCGDNMFHYLQVCPARSVTAQDFLDYIPLFAFTEDKPKMIAEKLRREYTNHFWSENQNPYQFILNALEQRQKQHPQSPIVAVSLQHYFSMVPPQEQEQYQALRNIEMKKCLEEAVGTQTPSKQPKRKL